MKINSQCLTEIILSNLRYLRRVDQLRIRDTINKNLLEEAESTLVYEEHYWSREIWTEVKKK